MSILIRIRKYFKLKVRVENPADIESAIWVLALIGWLMLLASRLL